VNPAASIVLFTTLAGAAQGIAVVLAIATLAGTPPASGLAMMLWTATGMLVASLIASFFHLGHPGRAWRAVLMWRTSWMSREVIVLPLFIGVVAAWAALASLGAAGPATHPVFAGIVIAAALFLWYCTAMIYACIRFIQEWAHPLTVINYTALGIASGVVSCGALAVLAGEGDFARRLVPWALASTALAWFTRALSLWRNARLKPRSSLQSATGIRSARLVQTSMGMTGGSFNTREFFHGASLHAFRAVKAGFQVFAFLLPLILLAWALLGGPAAAWLLALASQAVGMLAERWFFFAQARHPQNLYYQMVS